MVRLEEVREDKSPCSGSDDSHQEYAAINELPPYVHAASEAARRDLLGALTAQKQEKDELEKRIQEREEAAKRALDEKEKNMSKEQKKDNRMEELLDSQTYLSKLSTVEQRAWKLQKCDKFLKEGRELMMGAQYKTACFKYQAAVDILGTEKEFFAETDKKTKSVPKSKEGKKKKKDGEKDKKDEASSGSKARDGQDESDEMPKFTEDEYKKMYECKRAQSVGNLSQAKLSSNDFTGAYAMAKIALKVEPKNPKFKFRLASGLIGMAREEPVAKRASHMLIKATAALSELRKDDNLKFPVLENQILEICQRRKQIHIAPFFHRLPSFWTNKKHFSYRYHDECPGYESNLVIFMHGFGDNFKAMENLCLQMKLPHAASLCLNGPNQLSEDLVGKEAYSWFDLLDDDYNFITPSKDNKRRLTSLKASRAQHLDPLFDHLINDCGWDPCNIFVIGFGQGAVMAADFLWNPAKCLADSKKKCLLGGVVAKMGSVLPERWLCEESFINECTEENQDQEKAKGLFLLSKTQDQPPCSAGVESIKRLHDRGVKCESNIEKNAGLTLTPTEARKVFKFLSDRMLIPGLPKSAKDAGFVEVAPGSCDLEHIDTIVEEPAQGA